MKADAKLVGLSELRLSLDNQTTCESAAESQIPPLHSFRTTPHQETPSPAVSSSLLRDTELQETVTPWGYVPTQNMTT